MKHPKSPVFLRSKGTITEKVHVVLPNGTWATILPIYQIDEIPESLVEFLHQEFNLEIDRGQTYPYNDLLTLDEFREYWFHSFVAIFVEGNGDDLSETDDWEQKFLGTYYVKPNYVGRASHNCNAGFLVNHRKRGQKIGKTLGANYLKWAPILGYTYSVFNLVFETNVASVQIWDSLGFERIGYLKNAAILKGYDEPVGAIIFGKDLN